MTRSRCGSRAAASPRSHFTYTARAETGAKVLILSAENYTAGVPNYPDTTGPTYLTYYTDALDANGVAYDIYDVDKRGNRSPDWLGVLEPLRRGASGTWATTT